MSAMMLYFISLVLRLYVVDDLIRGHLTLTHTHTKSSILLLLTDNAELWSDFAEYKYIQKSSVYSYLLRYWWF